MLNVSRLPASYIVIRCRARESFMEGGSLDLALKGVKGVKTRAVLENQLALTALRA